MDLKSAIHPAALDLVLSSATNASQKGQSQYSTPVALAQALAVDLPDYRPVIIDLTCGPGNLLAGCRHKTTDFLLGCDIDPRKGMESAAACSCALKTRDGNRLLRRGGGTSARFIHADLTALYDSMRKIDFRADLLVLNPPWSLNWHSPRLEGLSESLVPAVRKTFKGLAPSASIDSTLATLMIALDRLSGNGEGLLIGYTSTLDRLLFAEGAPGARLVQHIWKRIHLPDVKPPDQLGAIELPEPLKLSDAIYFSAGHTEGPTGDGRRPRFMTRLNGYNCRQDTIEQWTALAERAAALQTGAPPSHHLTLQGNEIHVRLGLFDTALTKINHDLARTALRLANLNGRNPMQVVMQRDERNFILGLLKAGADGKCVSHWTVAPGLRDAVQAAVAQYNAMRAPLVPLPKIQRLGYLDESDDILCLTDLSAGGRPVFRKGERYSLATRSVRFTRTVMKPNLHGEEEELELSGQELAILISASGDDWCFMEAGLRAPNVKVGDDKDGQRIDFTLQELVDHFDIPEVPDVASADPARFNVFLEQLHELEQLTATA